MSSFTSFHHPCFSEHFLRKSKNSPNPRAFLSFQDFNLSGTFLILKICIKIRVDYSFSQYNFSDFDVHTDFLAVYKYATENDINESCIDSPVHYPEVLHPLPWEPTVAFASGRYEIDPSSLECRTVVPPSYKPYPRSTIKMYFNRLISRLGSESLLRWAEVFSGQTWVRILTTMG